jgi:hypothetical protein
MPFVCETGFMPFAWETGSGNNGVSHFYEAKDGGFGINLVAGLYRHLNMRDVFDQHEQEQAALPAAEGVQIASAPFLRALMCHLLEYEVLCQGPPVGDLRTVICNLVRRCDLLEQGAVGRDRRAYLHVRMIHCLVAFGYLKNAADLKELSHRCIRAVSDDPCLNQFLFDGLEEQNLPSRTTLCRHRSSPIASHSGNLIQHCWAALGESPCTAQSTRTLKAAVIGSCADIVRLRPKILWHVSALLLQ